MRLMRNQGLALEPSHPEGGGRSRTNVLVSVWISTSCPNSYQLFKRCASHLSSIPIDRARERRAAACEYRLFLIRRRHSSAVEQLFRKSRALCAVLPCVAGQYKRSHLSAVRFQGMPVSDPRYGPMAWKSTQITLSDFEKPRQARCIRRSGAAADK